MDNKITDKLIEKRTDGQMDKQTNCETNIRMDTREMFEMFAEKVYPEKMLPPQALEKRNIDGKKEKKKERQKDRKKEMMRNYFPP